MKKRNLLLAFLLLICLSFVFVACNKEPKPEPEPQPQEHVCEHVCPTCGKCTDADCKDPACAEKCQGHEVTPTHVCEHVCPTCGKCTDPDCKDPACADKCQGHEQTIEHLSAFVSANDGAKVRNYNEVFDTLIEDFSAANAGNVNNHLRVVVDNLAAGAPVSPDASIYKMATGVYAIETYDAIGFRIRTVGEGKLDLSNLVLALRGDDAYDCYEIVLADAVDADGEALPELSSEYQDFIICPNLSIEDDSTEYQLAGAAGASGVKVLDKILGFHLYCKGECAQVIEIEKVFLVKGADKTDLDVFNREKVNKADDTCWWRDSTGFIVQKGVNVKDAPYAVSITTDEANLVLNVMGDTTGAKLGDVAWADLKDNEGNPVKNAVNGAFYPLVINLENSGLGKSFNITSTTELVISKVFLSDLIDKEAVKDYPVIDAKNIAMFDNFNRTQSGFDGDYDKSSTNPVVTGAGLNYALSYNNGDKVTIADGHVTFDATTEVNYINFKEGHTVYDGQKYLVLVVKATDGATFNDFRFDVGNGVTYINQMYSAFGLKLPEASATDYPYIDANGYMWLIIDLAESGMVPNANDGFIDFYYSGTGKLLIDAAFYCDEEGAHINYEDVLINASVEVASLAGYAYAQGFCPEGDKYVKLVFTCSDDSTLKTFRFEGSDGAKWVKDGQIFDQKGNVVSADTPLAGLTLVIDVEASGLDLNAWNHIHCGDFDGTVTSGACSFAIYRLHDPALDKYEDILINAEDAVANLGAYAYAQGFCPEGDAYIKLVFTCEDDSTLKTFRFEGSDGAKWVKDGQIIDKDGNVVSADTPLKGLTLVIDVEASGLDLNAWNHIHCGDFDGTVTGGACNIAIYRVHDKTTDKYEDILINAEDAVANLGAYAYAQGFCPEGDAFIKLVFTCEDDSTLKTFRFEGSDGAKWVKDGQIFDQDGNAVSADTPLAGLTLIIDVEKSGLDLNAWNHIHCGDFDGTVTGGACNIAIYRVHEKAQTQDVLINEAVEVASLGAYAYAQGFCPEGDKYVKLVFTCEDDSTLKTFRFEGSDGAKWVKDGQIYGEDGNAISADTPLKGLTLVIDVEASGLDLKAWNHIHCGDFDGTVTSGACSFAIYRIHDLSNPYAVAMEGLNQGE